MTCLGLISSRTDLILPHERHVPEPLESVAYEQGLKHGMSFRKISERKISCHGIENKRDNQSSQQTTVTVALLPNSDQKIRLSVYAVSIYN
jgi:hypothetical protein